MASETVTITVEEVAGGLIAAPSDSRIGAPTGTNGRGLNIE
ncbi:hypothetical protein [Halostella salina]|nr:hypothetical protein [Halostella salina]